MELLILQTLIITQQFYKETHLPQQSLILLYFK